MDRPGSRGGGRLRVASRLAVAAALVLVGVVAWAASGFARSADSITFCVAAPSCTGTSEPSLDAALTAAYFDPGTNDIVLGPGTYAPPGGGPYRIANDPVHITGAGSGIGGGPTTTLAPVFLYDSGSVIADVALRSSTPGVPALLLADAGPAGVGPTADHVSATSDASSDGIGVLLGLGTSLNDSNVVVSTHTSGVHQSLGIYATTTASDYVPITHVNGVAVDAEQDIVATNMSLDIRQSYLAGHRGIFLMAAQAYLEDDAILVGADPAAAPTDATSIGIFALADSSYNDLVQARNVTIAGAVDASGANRSGPDSTGIWAEALGPAGVRVNLTSSIVWNLDHSLATEGDGAIGIHAGWSDLRWSFLNWATVPADFSELGPNDSVDPAFRDASDGNLRLTAGSPVVDAGAPGDLSSAEPPVDLGGQPRITDGNYDGSAVRDMGAYEYQAPPLPGHPSGSGAGSDGGTRRFGTSTTTVLRGTPGNDWLFGARARHPELLGGRGNDHLYAGRHGSHLVGGPGNDVFYSADSAKDIVDCGPGRDTAYVDRLDVVRGCERVFVFGARHRRPARSKPSFAPPETPYLPPLSTVPPPPTTTPGTSTTTGTTTTAPGTTATTGTTTTAPPPKPVPSLSVTGNAKSGWTIAGGGWDTCGNPVSLTDGGSSLGSATPNGSGGFSFTTSALKSGDTVKGVQTLCDKSGELGASATVP